MNLFELWIGLWHGWGEWWPTIDWGNASAWFSSVLTSVSVLLAVLIIRRDKARSALVHADAFVVWADYIHVVGPEPKWLVDVHSYNSGDRPIIRPYIMAYARPGVRALGTLKEREPNKIAVVIEPKATNTIQLMFPDQDPRDLKLYVDFTDMTGYTYRRLLNSNKYLNSRQINWRYWHRISWTDRVAGRATSGRDVVNAAPMHAEENPPD
ncbi:hypothetical protein [Conyzicola sp.]|uniref:hypothetical protein n=1 Tax=Conyzicola sp. TaxID=1969404 RepID=UPI003988DBB0